MYMTYAWIAGATAAQVTADIAALIAGADIATLSASCNKPGSSAAGEASGWTLDDGPYGVVSRAGQAGGPRVAARITASATPKLQLAAVDQWSVPAHTAAYASTAVDCSLSLAAAGSVQIVATADALLIAASDWSAWGMVVESKRDGPALAADAAAPGSVLIGSASVAYMPRVKYPAQSGDASNPAVTVQSSYGSLSASAARNRAEALYIPMVPAVLTYSQVPVGELVNVQVAGGYGQSGDYMLDAAAVTWQLAKQGATILAVQKR